MGKTEKSKIFVESQHINERIEISGFEAVDESAHMLEWLRIGKDFRQFVIHDIETELYAQDTSSQLLSVHCKANPNFETKVKTDYQSQIGVVTEFIVMFPIFLRVRATDGAIWRLDVEHSYHARNLDVPDNFQLRLNFTIVGHQAGV